MNVPQQLSKDETTNDASSTEATAAAGGFGMIEPVVQPVEVQTVDVQQEGQLDRFITADELKENRLSQRGNLFISVSLVELLQSVFRTPMHLYYANCIP